ncbi:MAG: TauD/TfdA family dioxygenase, partial [Cyanobacteria bacterium P01_C01_bin.72]
MLATEINREKTISKLIATKDFLQVEWEDGVKSEFYYLWLRDNCPATPRVNCQRTTDPLNIPAESYPEKVSLNQNKKVEIVWANEGHVSEFEPSWLRNRGYAPAKTAQSGLPRLWGASKANAIARADYQQVLQDEAKLRDWLLAVRDEGIAILENVTTEPGKILEVASAIGCVRPTYWGSCNDIKSIANPETDAFTNLRILPHTDLSYFAAPPAYLIFHYLQVAEIGGENTLIDGFKVAEDLRQQAPEKFKLLSTLPVEFRFQHTDADLVGLGEIIHLDSSGAVKSIRFSSRAIQPFNFAPAQIKPYYAAYRTFLEMCNSDEYQLRIKFKAGDFVVLDNHRLLHGRTQ